MESGQRQNVGSSRLAEVFLHLRRQLALVPGEQGLHEFRDPFSPQAESGNARAQCFQCSSAEFPGTGSHGGETAICGSEGRTGECVREKYERCRLATAGSQNYA